MIRVLFVGLLLIIILLALASVAVAANDPPAGGLVVWQDGSDPPVVQLPDEPFYNQVEDWAIAALLAAGLMAVQVTVSISILKSIFLAPLRDNDTTGDFFDLEVWNDFTVYKIVILVITAAGAYFVVAGQMDFNPWQDAPFQGLANLSTFWQNLMSTALVTFFAVTGHEGLDNWLRNKQQE